MKHLEVEKPTVRVREYFHAYGNLPTGGFASTIEKTRDTACYPERKISATRARSRSI
jgi:hypothetical protein